MKKYLLHFALIGISSFQLAYGSERLCVVAGQYQGSYVGSDEGRLTVNVDPTTGITTGTARSSRTVGQLAIGGVVNDDGRMSSDGAVEGGTRFIGQFSNAGVARGQWSKPITIDGVPQTAGGFWELTRVSTAEGCEAKEN
jgi:hypothetical protein